MRSIEDRLKILLSTIGNTRIKCMNVDGIDLCFKLEYDNPTGSHKDRTAVYMIKGLIERGKIKEGECVAELSSGNTAVSVAWASSFLGLKSLLLVKEYASNIKKNLVRLYGGELLIVKKDTSVKDAKNIAEERGCVFLNQDANEDNFLAHYETTGPEILNQVEEGFDFFIMGIGTGGTVTGAGTRIKEKLKNVKIAGVVPTGSALSEKRGGGFKPIEGLVSSKIPELFERHKNVVDFIVEVSLEEALKAIREIFRRFLILPGPSTGANFVAFQKLVRDGLIEKGQRVVTIAADQLIRYPELLKNVTNLL